LHSGTPLLAPDEPPAFTVENAHGRSPFFLICDHAGARIPRRLNSLGVSPADLLRHIAWDIGAAGVARKLSARLDAFLILQTYSRLVIDCNRSPGSEQSIVKLSEATPIPGNETVPAMEVEAREEEIFRPYHQRIGIELDRRKAVNQRTLVIAVHSFTPVFHGSTRRWHAGLLYNRDRRLAAALLPVLRGETQMVVGDNEPYSVSDSTDYALPVYGEQRGLPHVGIEIRQDLIAHEAGQAEWAERLAQALQSAATEIET
jgi:predicted N-formylglutamate amidohydrolase